MIPNIKYFITADYASIDAQSNKLSVNGFFDKFNIVTFPSTAPRFFMILGLSNIRGVINIEITISSPNGEIVFSQNGKIEAEDPEAVTNIVTELIDFPLVERGAYSVKIKDTDKLELIGENYLHADYWPQRNFKPEEIEEILKNPNLAKGARIEIFCPKCNKEFKLELNLDHTKQISDGYEKFPSDNKIDCCDNIIDLTGVRRQIEWRFGSKLNK